MAKTPENPYIHGKGGQHPQPCPACIWECGRESCDAEVTALQAKLREAEAACAKYGQVVTALSRIITLIDRELTDGPQGPHEIICKIAEHIEQFSRMPNLPPSPGAPLLARLEVADELTKYLEHNEGCALPNSYHEDRPDSCSCGLAELLQKIQKLREAK